MDAAPVKFTVRGGVPVRTEAEALAVRAGTSEQVFRVPAVVAILWTFASAAAWELSEAAAEVLTAPAVVATPESDGVPGTAEVSLTNGHDAPSWPFWSSLQTHISSPELKESVPPARTIVPSRTLVASP